MTDDVFPNNTNTNGSVGAPGTVTGEIETDFDEDWFAVTLTAGNYYQFALNGNTLSDPLLELRDSSGNLVTSDSLSGPGLNSLITYTATVSGTFYLVARAFFSTQTGTYTLTATDLGGGILPGITITEGATDAQGDISTTDTIVSGDTFEGTLSSASDRDFVAIELTAGVTYTFDLQGADSGSINELTDPFLVLRDANDNFVAQDDNSGNGLEATIFYTPDATGTFYLDIRTFGSDGGTYALVTSPEQRTENDPVPPGTRADSFHLGSYPHALKKLFAS